MGQQAADAPQSRAQTDATALLDRQTKGLSADCLFQTWDKDRQMQAYKELNKIQDPNDNVPDLILTFDNNGRHLESKGGNRGTEYCAPQDLGQKNGTRTDRGSNEQLNRRQADTSRRTTSDTTYENPRETERLAHPERPAEKIEGLAKQALGGDERAKLDLRRELEKLANEPNKEFRDKVLKKMVDDGTYLANPFNGKPHVVVTRDASGKPENIKFSDTLGVYNTEIPMNKSFAQQVDEAQKNYVDSLGKVTGGLGKFDAEATMKAYDILQGAEPTNLRWFMMVRKEQGRPAVDLDKVNAN